MIQLVWDAGFKRSYKKRISSNAQLKQLFRDALERLADDPFAAELRTHKLTGKLSNCWAFSVDDDHRIVFMFLKGKSKVLLIDIGTHDEVY